MGDLFTSTDLNRLGKLLWEYRGGFERVQFLLETQMLLIANGRDDQLHHMVELLDEANARLGRLDLEREVLLGIGPDGEPPRLRSLIETVDEPWDAILTEHAEAIETAMVKTKALVDRSDALITKARTNLPDMAALLASESSVPASAAATYGRSGRSDVSTGAQAYLFENRI